MKFRSDSSRSPRVAAAVRRRLALLFISLVAAIALLALLVGLGVFDSQPPVPPPDILPPT